MEDEHFDIIGDDGELLPRKPKPVEGVRRRTLVMSLILTALAAAVIGSVATLLLVSQAAPPASESASADAENFSATIAALQTVQSVVQNSLPMPAVRASQAALIASFAPAPTATFVPAEQCYCDYPGCHPPNWVMKRGDSLDSFQIDASDPETFGWYIMRNLNPARGIYWEVYPADYRFVCDDIWDNCQFNGYYTTYECVMSQQARLCDTGQTCRFYEPLSE